MHCDDPAIASIISQQGWSDETVLRLLWSFVEADEKRAAEVEAFFKRIAAEKNAET